jgi:hypothetical protein
MYSFVKFISKLIKIFKTIYAKIIEESSRPAPINIRKNIK